MTPSKTLRALMICGVAGGPLFIVSSLIQAALVDGFDLRKQQVSTLALGEHGWVQVTTFVLTGLLILAWAAGLRTTLKPGRGRLLIPCLFAIYGLAMIIGGVFTDDPAFGFPPGATEGAPQSLTWHATIHALGAVNAFAAQVVAALAFTWRFAGQGRRWWAAYSLLTFLGAAALIATVDPVQPGSGATLAIACIVTGAWTTAVAIDQLRRLPEGVV